MMDAQPIAYVKITTATKMFDISRSAIYRLKKAKKITIHNPTGGAARINVDELQRCIEGDPARNTSTAPDATASQRDLCGGPAGGPAAI